MLGRDLVGPALDRRTLDLDGAAAVAADQVVVMALGAAPVRRFAVSGPEYVDLPRVGQRLEGPVDSGQADGLTGGPELLVDLLGGPEVVEILERRRYRRTLTGRACSD